MNKFIGQLKDFFYATTDYLIILLIVVVASGIISWRLDSLFDKNSSRHEQTVAKTKSSTSKSEKPQTPKTQKVPNKQEIPDKQQVPQAEEAPIEQPIQAP